MRYRIEALWLAIRNYIAYLKNVWEYRGRKFKNPLHGGKFRNCMCPCGSGTKVKKCHGKESSINFREYHKMIKMITKARLDVAASVKHIESL